MDKKTLCIIEPRHIPEDTKEVVLLKLRGEIARALRDGFGFFQAALNSGAGLVSARLIAELRDTQYSDIFLELVTAAPKERKMLPDELRLLANGIRTVQLERGCNMVYLLHRSMILESARVIIICGNQEDDEMAAIMDYSTGIGKDVRYIKP